MGKIVEAEKEMAIGEGEKITPEFVHKMATILTEYILTSGIKEIANRDSAYILASVIAHRLSSVSEDKPPKTEPLVAVSHRFKKETIEELDLIVAKGSYNSRSDVIRKIVEDGIQKCRED